MRVTIDHAKLVDAASRLSALAGRLESQAHRATGNTPIGLDSLTSSTIRTKVQWMRDQQPLLDGLADIALLLDTDGNGRSEFEVGNTVTDVRTMLGETLADTMESIDYETDPQFLASVSAVLAQHETDGVAMAAMFQRLGADGTVGVLGNLETLLGNVFPGEEIQALAEHLRDGLETASNEPGFPGEEFGRELVRYSVAPLLTDEERDEFDERFDTGMNGASLLTFLMQGTGYSDDLVLGAARTLDEFERMSADGDLPADYWYGHNGHSSLDTGGHTGWYDDPMAAIMHNLGEHPEAGLTFFTEHPERQEYYFNDRSWEADGYAGISHAALGIGTDADNLDSRPEDTTLLVSSFLDHVADSDGFNPEDAKAASPYLSELLQFYMPAVDLALRAPNGDGDPASQPFTLDHFGHFDDYPVLFTDDLDSLMQVAMSTETGMTNIAEGVGAFQQTQINNAAVALGLDPDDPGVRTELRDVLQRTAALQGFAEYSVGQVEIDAARDRDAQRQAFIDLVGEAAGLVPLPGADQVGELTSKAIDFGWSQGVDLGTDAAGDHFTSEAAGATDRAEDRAAAGVNRVKVNAYLALVEGGVIPENEVPDIWFENGSLIGADEIDQAEVSQYTQSAMNGINEYLTNYDLEGAYKNEFLNYYSPAGE